MPVLVDSDWLNSGCAGIRVWIWEDVWFMSVGPHVPYSGVVSAIALVIFLGQDIWVL